MVYYDRQSIRLPHYDYASTGNYFITICTIDRELLFGNIKNNLMIYNEFGDIANKYWVNIPAHFPNSKLDEFIVMPNHIHGIIHIVGVQNFEPLNPNFEPLHVNQYQHMIPQSIGSIIRSYKSEITKYFRLHSNKIKIWQRNYYEHIIRNDKEYYATKNYIKTNVKNWNTDKFLM